MLFRLWWARKWYADEKNVGGLLFPKSPNLIKFVERLIRRPRRVGAPEKSLPILLFVDVWPDHSPIDGIEDRLRKCSRTIVGKVSESADLSGDGSQAVLQSILQLLGFLGRIVDELSQEFPSCRKLRFPHYALAVWLVDLIGRSQVGNGGQPDQASQRLDNEFKRFIKERYLQSLREPDVHNLASDVPWWVRLSFRVLPPAGLLLMRITWSAPRWFRRRNTGLVTKNSFTGLARQFANWTAEPIEPDAIRELIVDAFLQDLRRAYRRTSLFGAGRRRTTYPVLILRRYPEATSVSGFVQLVQQCRNLRVARRGGRTASRWDPLLIITDRPAGIIGPATTADPDPLGAANAESAHLAWRNRLDNMAPASRDHVLVLRVPQRPDPWVEPDGLRDELLNTPIPRRVPVVIPLVTTAALVAGLIIVFGGAGSRCWTPPWTPQMYRHDDASGISECVGLASPGFRFFSDLRSVYKERINPVLADQLRSVEESIVAANDRIVEKANHRTIVHLSILSPADPRPLEAELAQLRGLAVAQAESEASAAPLRVLLANAGDGLSYANEAVEAIGLEKERDPSIVGVVGLGISVDATREAARSLAAYRLPTVGTLLSATDLATQTTQYYHQVGFTNEREASIAAFFAVRRLGVDSATVYYSGNPSDLYSNDLARRFAAALRPFGITAQLAPYQQSPGVGIGDPVDKLGQSACGLARDRNGLVFYAGRAERLLEFLSGMKTSCEGKYPKLLIGDDVNRFTDTGLAEFPGLTVNYLSFASSLAWPGGECEGARSALGFYQKYLAAYDCRSTREGAAAVAYDAALVFRVAIERATQDTTVPPSGDRILGEINEMVGENGVNGASGRFELDSDYANGRVPVNKAILVLRSDSGAPATVQLLCGRLDTAEPPPDPQCPSDVPVNDG